MDKNIEGHIYQELSVFFHLDFVSVVRFRQV